VTGDIEHPMQDVFPDRAAFAGMRSAYDALKPPPPSLRTGFWLLV
jgi:hypothetical protein